MPQLVNPFTQEGNWCKANLHTHTTASDGQVTLEEAVNRYRRGGYGVLAITDHGRIVDVSGLSDEKMLVMSGMEFHPPIAHRNVLYHLVGLNLPSDFEFSDPDDAVRCIADIEGAGGVTIVAHPFWCGLESPDFYDLEGAVAVEVWNAACDPAGRAGSENEWSHALDRGIRIPAVAVDDTHWKEDADVLAAWTCLKLPALTPDHVLEAIRTGCCYASRGPKVHDFRLEGGTVTIRCSPVERIHFISTPGEGRRRLAPPGEGICEFSLEVPERWSYVRAAVTDAAGRRAWTNPIFL